MVRPILDKRKAAKADTWDGLLAIWPPNCGFRGNTTNKLFIYDDCSDYVAHWGHKLSICFSNMGAQLKVKVCGHVL